MERGTDIMSLLLYLWIFLETWILLHSLNSEIFFSLWNLHFISQDGTEREKKKSSNNCMEYCFKVSSPVPLVSRLVSVGHPLKYGKVPRNPGLPREEP